MRGSKRDKLFTQKPLFIQFTQNETFYAYFKII